MKLFSEPQHNFKTKSFRPRNKSQWKKQLIMIDTQSTTSNPFYLGNCRFICPSCRENKDVKPNAPRCVVCDCKFTWT